MKDYELINGKLPPFESDRNIASVKLTTVPSDEHKSNHQKTANSSATATTTTTDHELSNNGKEEEEEEDKVIKELKKIQRQNFLTHCLVSAMIVLTVTWQLSEVSLILKVKDGLNHPFRSVGGFLAGMFKGFDKPPIINGTDDEKPANGKQKQQQGVDAIASFGPAIPRLHY